jgi:hypothetical protein
MEKVILNLDSRFRNKLKYPNSMHFSIEINTPVKNVTSITLSSVEFPNVFYIFSDKRMNNFFFCNQTKITIDNGNYTLHNLVNCVECKLKALDITFEVKYSETKGTITIKSHNDFTIDFRATTPYGSLGEYLGFENRVYHAEELSGESEACQPHPYYTMFGKLIRLPTVDYTQEDTTDHPVGGCSAITASRPLRLSGEDYFFIKVNDYGRVGMMLNENLVFAKIITDNNKYSTLFNNRSDYITKTHEFRQPTNISRFDIQVFDYLGNQLENFSEDFSMTFEICFVYNSNLKNSIEKNIFK